MKKIMFNNKYGLTTAVLEGRKTMTRRIAYIGELNKPNSGYLTEGKLRGTYALCDSNSIVAKSLYKVGEVVAIAQNYNEVFDEFATIFYLQDKPIPDNFKAFGAASDEILPKTMPGWNNKMFVRASLMPHQIRITNIRIERLQDISDEDCLREGVEYTPLYGWYIKGIVGKFFTSPRDAFAALINKVSGKGTWESNLFVFVYEFELIK